MGYVVDGLLLPLKITPQYHLDFGKAIPRGLLKAPRAPVGGSGRAVTLSRRASLISFNLYNNLHLAIYMPSSLKAWNPVLYKASGIYPEILEVPKLFASEIVFSVMK